MATNLRLDPELEGALRQQAEETGRSQQDLIREALRAYLTKDPARAILPTGGSIIRPARIPYRQAERMLPLPEGVSNSLELLGRSDRF